MRQDTKEIVDRLRAGETRFTHQGRTWELRGPLVGAGGHQAYQAAHVEDGRDLDVVECLETPGSARTAVETLVMHVLEDDTETILDPYYDQADLD